MPANITVPPPPTEPALPAGQERSFRELALMLAQDTGFKLALATFSDLQVRTKLLHHLTGLLEPKGVILSQLEFTAGDPHASLLRCLQDHIRKLQISPDKRHAVSVIGLENLIALRNANAGPSAEGTGFLEEANLHRDAFAQACPMPLVIWLTPADTTAFAQSATDLWHWRSATFDFSTDSTSSIGMIESLTGQSRTSEAANTPDKLRSRSELLQRQLTELQTSPQADTPRALSQRANLLGELGNVFTDLVQYDQAKQCLEERLRLTEQIKDEPNLAAALNDLAYLLLTIGQFDQAEPLMRRALIIDERNLGPQHPNVSIRLNNLAQLLQATNRLAEAEPLMRRALAIDEQNFGPNHPNVSRNLNNLALLLNYANRLAEAEPLMRRALAIDEQNFGPDDSNVANRLKNLASLLQDTNRLAEAEPMIRRALAIDEHNSSPEHPEVAIDLNNLAQLLKATNRLTEAEALMRRARAIDELSFGSEHPNVARDLNNLASLLQATNRLIEAIPLMEQCLKILQKFKQKTGHQYPNWETAISNFKTMLEAMKLPPEEIAVKLRNVSE